METINVVVWEYVRNEWINWERKDRSYKAVTCVGLRDSITLYNQTDLAEHFHYHWIARELTFTMARDVFESELGEQQYAIYSPYGVVRKS